MDFYLERKHTDDYGDEVIVFRGEVRMSEVARLRLLPIDRALLDDVGGDDKAAPADYLLALEMLFRRHQEQTPNGEVRGASRPAGEASGREAATSTVVLGGDNGGNK